LTIDAADRLTRESLTSAIDAAADPLIGRRA
jgi:hypothetical protein